MKAHQIMTSPVISVRTDTTVEEVVRLLITHHISSVPVVDAEARVIGIVSKNDLLPKRKDLPFATFALPTVFKQWVFSFEQLSTVYEYARRFTATDVMTAVVVCVDVEEDIEQIVQLMTRHNIKRIPVTAERKLVGIITRTDLIRLLVQAECNEYVEEW